MHCGNLRGWKWAKCIASHIPPQGAVNPVLPILPEESQARRELRNTADEELNNNPQLGLSILRELYYDKEYELLVHFGPRLEEMITTASAEHKEVLARATLLYARSLEHCGNSEADSIFDLAGERFMAVREPDETDE